MGDSILTLAIQILAFLICAVGVYTTLYPLSEKKHKHVCLAIFVAIGLAVVILTTMQSRQASKEQTELRNQIAQISANNHQDLAEIQARLDAVVAAVKTAPANTNIKTLASKVVKLAGPPPTGLKATAE